MNKNDFINKLKELNYQHNSWYAAAEALIMCVETESSGIPKSYTDCEIGAWFYGEGYQLIKFEHFKEVEHIHIELHRLFLEIYKQKTIFENKKIKNKNKYQKIQKENMRLLKAVSNELIEKIKNFIEEIKKTDDDLFMKKLV